MYFCNVKSYKTEMQMKKFILLTAVAALPLGLMAQDDDMYFVPTKENMAKEAKAYGMPKNTYYSGSQRSVDEYNRRAWSSVAPIDSAGNDIIDFSAVRGVYPDSAYSEVTENDYQYTKRMSRFEGYTASDAYWEGYRDGRWTSPWYYSSYYSWYDPWYWNDPWYYSGYYGWAGYYGGWYSPWYYGGYYRPWHYYGGWYSPRYHYGGGHYRPSGSARFHVSRPASAGSRTYSNSSRFGTSSRYSNGSFGNGSTMSRGSSGSTRSSGSFSSGGGTRSSGGGSSFGGGRSGGGGSSRGGTFSRGR